MSALFEGRQNPRGDIFPYNIAIIGNYLFNFLCGYPKSNNLFTKAQKNFSSEDGDQKLINLMNLMSIDIALAEYENYEEFLGDFPMYRACKGAEENFKSILDNM